MSLTDKERGILKSASVYRPYSPSRGLTAVEFGARPVDCASLVRKGYLSSLTQSEHVRGERRIYYKIYEVTAAGHAELTTTPTR